MADRRHPPKPPKDKKEKGGTVTITTLSGGMTNKIVCPENGARSRLQQLKRNGHQIQ